MKKSADSNLTMNNNRITGLQSAVQSSEPVTKGQGDDLYMAKTTTLNNIPLANGHLDLNGYKIVNTQPLSIFDLNPGTQQNNTLTTIDWVENRAGVYRDQAKTYADGQDLTNFVTLDGKIALVDSKKVNYTNGIDSMSYARGDYNMGLFNIYNMASAT